MRKLLLLFSLFSVNAFAQTKTENYTMETVCLNGNCTEKIQTIKYLDGLGREIQSISNSFNPNLKALVNLTEYDSLGRQTREYLPMAVSSTLEFQPGLNESAVKGYYNGLNLYGTDANYVYAETKFENNPLQRKIKTSAPGESWKMNGGHEIRYEYAFNSAADHVKKFDLSTTYHTTEKIYINSLTAAPTVYPQNMLYKTIIRNENWQSSDGNTNNLTEKYTDKEGQVVLERKFNQGTALNTYYIYDVYGNLAYVLPPLLSEKGTITTTLLNNLGYQYRYDSRNRLVQKMEPGKLWESIVYDKNDRVVYTQSANQTNQEWSFIKYDKYGRVVYSGLHTSSATRLALQNELNGSTVNFEQKSTASFQNNGLNNIYYTNAAFPKTNMTVLIVNYYDTYENTGVTFPTAAYHTIVNDPSSKKLKGLGTTSFVNILGTTTWNKTYNFYEQDYLRSVATEIHYPGNGYTKSFFKLNYVDQPTDSKVVHKRPNSSEAERIIEEHFDYDDLLRLTKHTHQVNSGKLETLTVNRYDDLGRLTSKKVGNTEVNPLQTIDYKYNIRGWMTDLNNVDASLSDATRLFAFKISYDQLKYGPRRAATATGLYNGNISQTFWKSSSNNTLRSYDYRYDGINQLTDAIFYKGTGIYAKNYYNENITYDHNGNITTLQRNGDTESGSTPVVIDNLHYTYSSNTNKLSAVTDSSAHPSGFSSSKTGVLYEYDAAGNLKKDHSKDIIEIKYNHLNLATEVLWLNGSTITFVYDATGKKVQKQVSKTNPGSNPVPVRTDYLNGFQYKNGSLQFFPTAEGYVNVIVKDNNEKLSYVYNYKDHLGNTRVSYAWDEHENKLKTIEENHYYPYGLQHNGYQGGRVIGDLEDGGISYPKTAALPGIDIGTERMSYSGSESYAYHYNGNEFQSELGMNWYDMNMRMYDPALARWMVQDPVIHYTKSTYRAFDNNPVYFADPSGATTEGSNDGNSGGIESIQLGFGVTLANVAGVGAIESTAAPGYGGGNAGRKNDNPIFDSKTGKYLGKDDRGLGGEIIVMDREVFNKLDGKGGKAISHSDALKYGTLVGDLETNAYNISLFRTIVQNVIEIYSESSIFNSEGTDPSKIKITAYSPEIGLKTKGAYTIGFDRTTFGSWSSPPDTYTINFDLRNTFTVANIYSNFEHEAKGHGGKGWGQFYKNSDHKALYLRQSQSPIFKFTTPAYQKHVRDWSK
ncbi:DUF6443 domain-containing protein [Empedobacter brevis]|uniref:DUF6443 domain-containing protein n=1 Tax=Empedobacter brevis TaxID=247 RepID=UPI0028A082C3|nr:DUF6443 domain-containing protein [Empedobacter brevis]